MVNGYTGPFTGIVTSNSYNSRLQPGVLSAANPSQTIFSLSYNFNLGSNNGSVAQIVNNVDPSRSVAFVYDSLNRIAQAYTTDLTSGNCWGETFATTPTDHGVLPPVSHAGIDAWGNLTNQSGVSDMDNCQTEGLTATANTNNQLSILSYDIAGNVIDDGNGNQPSYDAENTLAKVAGVTYDYDADGVRVEKSSGTMYWPGPSGTLAETDLFGNINEEYIYFNGARIARVDRPSGTVHYYYSNHLGSHTVVTSATGVCEQDIDYFPYGRVVKDYCPTIAQHYKFTGKERDSESGLDNFGARYFGSSIGRFISPDRILIEKGRVLDPQQLNLYSYVRNNPLKFRDPTGMALEIAGDESARARAVRDIQRTVPRDERANVRLIEGTGKNGLAQGHFGIDARALNAGKASEDSNYHALRQIANSPGTVTLGVVGGNTTLNYVQNGQSQSTSFSQLNQGVSQQQLNAGEGVTGLTFAPAASLSGVDQRGGAVISAEPGTTTSFINGDIQNDVTEAVATGHELYTHGLDSLLGGGTQVYHNQVGDQFDQNAAGVEKETKKNAEDNQ